MADYKVVRGDTLWSIANRNNMTLSTLLSMNPELAGNPNLIYSGQTVHLSKASTAATPKPVTAAAPKAPAPVARPSIETTLEQQLAGIPGTERDAYAALSTLFNSYGLGTLAPKILTYLQNGFGSDTISVMLQQTPEYRARFAGNDARIAKGLQVLTPAEYLSTEASYRQLLQAGGLDPSFMSSANYAEWIGKDISPTEIQNRVNMAVQATVMAPPSVTSAFAQMGIHVGDLASVFLNDGTPPPVLQQKLATAQIMAAGLEQGLPAVQTSAQTYAQMGVTYQQAQAGEQRVAQVLPAANALSSIYQQQHPYNQDIAENEFLGQSGVAQNERLALGRQETANFNGQGGVGKNSMTQQTQGAPGF